MRDAGDSRSTAFLNSRVGEIENVLMETETRGRTEQFAEITIAAPARAGEIVKTKVVNTAGALLSGEACA